MRVLRFSLVLTIFLFALLPALTGFVIGLFFLLQYLYSHTLGAQASQAIEWQHASDTVLLTTLHGPVMYGVVSLILAVVVTFMLDKGMSHLKRLLFSLAAAAIMVVWADTTVGFTGSYVLIFVAAFISYYLALQWWSVPPEQRTAARIFEEKGTANEGNDLID